MGYVARLLWRSKFTFRDRTVKSDKTTIVCGGVLP